MQMLIAQRNKKSLIMIVSNSVLPLQSDMKLQSVNSPDSDNASDQLWSSPQIPSKLFQNRLSTLTAAPDLKKIVSTREHIHMLATKKPQRITVDNTLDDNSSLMNNSEVGVQIPFSNSTNNYLLKMESFRNSNAAILSQPSGTYLNRVIEGKETPVATTGSYLNRVQLMERAASMKSTNNTFNKATVPDTSYNHLLPTLPSESDSSKALPVSSPIQPVPSSSSVQPYPIAVPPSPTLLKVSHNPTPSSPGKTYWNLVQSSIKMQKSLGNPTENASMSKFISNISQFSPNQSNRKSAAGTAVKSPYGQSFGIESTLTKKRPDVDDTHIQLSDNENSSEDSDESGHEDGINDI